MQDAARRAGPEIMEKHNETPINNSNKTDQAEPRLRGNTSTRGAGVHVPTAAAIQTSISRTRRTPANAGSGHGAAPSPLIVSSQKFTEDFTPPDYLVDGLMQRRFLYSLTGKTGGGKTAIALRLAAQVALGLPLGDHEIEHGRVLYFAGENPDDLRMRWIALSELMKFDLNTVDVHFVVGADTEISRMRDQIAAEVTALGGVSLIIVDTSAAYFNCEDCDDENDNVQAGRHARMFRSLTALCGRPAVLVLAHPSKAAKNDNLLPRGGGAFIAEVDGNFVVRKEDGLSEFHWQGKFRGPEFERISFELHSVTAEKLKDSKGRSIRTVIANPLSDEDRAVLEANQDQDGNAIIALMSNTPGLSLMEMAKTLGWRNSKEQPDKRRVQKGIARLGRSKLVAMDSETKRYVLTERGEAASAAIRDEEATSVLTTVPMVE